MANIPIEKKKTNWLPWILGGLVLAGIVILALALMDDESTEDVSSDVQAMATETLNGDETAQEEGLSEPVTTASTLRQNSPERLDGKSLKIDQMNVTRVVGDKSFYVTSSGEKSDREFFVVLDEERTPNKPIEGRYDVTAGQTLQITGSVQQQNDIKMSNLNLTDAEAQAMRDDQIYLYAQRLDISS